MHSCILMISSRGPGLIEAMLIAAFGHYKVIAVDYRMPPAAYFPAALDDAMTVWKAALRLLLRYRCREGCRKQ